MPRNRREIWSDDRVEEFKRLVEICSSIRAVLLGLGLQGAGANYRMANIRIKELGLSTEHWTRKGHLRGKNHNWAKKIPLEDVLSGKTKYTACSSKLKGRLFKEGFLEQRCYECGITDWQGKPISLELEHKDGDSLNNTIENLTILCPNCHSQTNTHRRAKGSISFRPDIQELLKTKTTQEVADITGCCTSTVRSWRRKYNSYFDGVV